MFRFVTNLIQRLQHQARAASGKSSSEAYINLSNFPDLKTVQQKIILATTTVPISLLLTFAFWYLTLLTLDSITNLEAIPSLTQGYAESRIPRS